MPESTGPVICLRAAKPSVTARPSPGGQHARDSLTAWPDVVSADLAIGIKPESTGPVICLRAAEPSVTARPSPGGQHARDHPSA